jgi:hypothetical protein
MGMPMLGWAKGCHGANYSPEDLSGSGGSPAVRRTRAGIAHWTAGDSLVNCSCKTF